MLIEIIRHEDSINYPPFFFSCPKFSHKSTDTELNVTPLLSLSRSRSVCLCLSRTRSVSHDGRYSIYGGDIVHTLIQRAIERTREYHIPSQRRRRRHDKLSSNSISLSRTRSRSLFPSLVLFSLFPFSSRRGESGNDCCSARLFSLTLNTFLFIQDHPSFPDCDYKMLMKLLVSAFERAKCKFTTTHSSGRNSPGWSRAPLFPHLISSLQANTFSLNFSLLCSPVRIRRRGQ